MCRYVVPLGFRELEVTGGLQGREHDNVLLGAGWPLSHAPHLRAPSVRLRWEKKKRCDRCEIKNRGRWLSGDEPQDFVCAFETH